MSQLDEDIRAADAMGISYGYYKALTYNPGKNALSSSTPTPKKRPRKYTDHQAFQLWQAGLTDAKIAKALGVSRISIVQWREQLELPSTWKNPIDTKKYRLASLQDGTAIVINSDDE